MTRSKQVHTDPRTRSKIDKHLSDINDKITEADIANVKTDASLIPDSDEESEKEANRILERKKKEDQEDKTNDEDGNSSNSVETPWNILKSVFFYPFF